MDRRVDFSDSGKLWILLAGFAVGLYTLWEVSNSIAAGSMRSAAMVAAAFAAFFIAGRISNDWRKGVYFFLTWLLFEDLIRKYMGNNMAVYFAKDVLVGVTYFSFVISRMKERSKPFHPPFKYALVAFFVLGLVQVFNPNSPSIFYGLLGMKLYFYYIPLMFVGYSLLREEKDLIRFYAINMGLAGVIASVGIVQSIVGINFLNPHSGADIELLGHLVRYTPSGLAVSRPPSVFVSDGRFGVYLLLAFVMGLGAAGFLLLRSRSGRNIVFPALALVVVAGMITGSRGAFVYFVATGVLLAVGALWGAPPGRAEGFRLVKAIRRTFVFTAVAMCLAVTIFPDVMGARWAYYRETVMPDSEYSETGNRIWDYPVKEISTAFADQDWAVGHGIGTDSLGMQYVMRIMDAPAVNVGAENGFGQLILELGILGPMLWLLWAGSLVYWALRTTLKLKGTWAFPVALSILWFAFLLLFPLTWGGLVQYQNFVSNAYLWLLVGVLFRLPDLVKQSPVNAQVSTVHPL